MKKKKNIIKKINANKFKFFFRKGFKHFFRRVQFKFKYFKKLNFYSKSLYKLKNTIKFYKFLNININKNFIKNRFNYFNYISNGLDLKYSNILQDLTEFDYIVSFDKKKSILLKVSQIEIIKYQRFLSFIDNNYFNFKTINIIEVDFLCSSSKLYYSILLNNYKLNYLLLIN